MMPKDELAQRVKSVHLLNWPQVPAAWQSESIAQELKLLIDIRPHVLKALEEKRRTGEIGGSLEAKVIFHSASERDLQYFENHLKILPAVFIVSQVEILKANGNNNIEGISEEFPKTTIDIRQADGEKCSRCWNYSPYVGKNPQHPTLCDRCSLILKEIE